MATAADIDEAIMTAADVIADASYDPALSLATLWAAWIAGTFGAAGVFTATDENGRAVRDWFPDHLIAQAAIEGPGNTDSGVIGTSACALSCARVLSAVKQAVINGEATAGQETAMVNLFNATWP